MNSQNDTHILHKQVSNQELLTFYYFQVTELWKKFCEEHMELFNLTMDEYSFLLASDLENIEMKLEEKNATIQRIQHLESVRQELINELRDHFPELQIESVKSLVELMSNYKIEHNEKHLFRFNALLIDLIEKIQLQNKRNQLFINKALISLKEIRHEVMGLKKFSTYSARGAAINKTT